MSKITARYFQVTNAENYNRTFREALSDISNILPLENRATQIDGFGYRLERFDNSRAGIIKGEMIKIQADNLPAEVFPDRLEELQVEEPGYGMAFVYDEQLSVVAVQFDNRVVSMSKFNGYLNSMDIRNGFHFRVIPGPDSWNTFMNGEIKKFKIKVALPQNLNVGVDDPMGESISALANAYESPFVTIEIGVGRRKRTISESIVDTASRFINTVPVESMRAKVADMAEEIDLLEEMLRDKGDIVIPSEPNESYGMRSQFIEVNLNLRRPYIAGIYGPDN